MNRKKEILILGFALFSMFFGAGNLLFPPAVGIKAGNLWFHASLGFFLTGIGLPLLGILAFTKVGSLENFANKVSPLFNKIYSTILILIIGPLFAIPRTGSTTFEMGVLPFFKTTENTQLIAIISAIIFFSITYFLVINESNITDILGKFLTPIILVTLLLITFLGIFGDLGTPVDTSIKGSVFSYGFMSGYQTMDALASVLFGVIIIRGLEAKGVKNPNEQKTFLTKASIIAASGLGFIYLSLIYLGAQISSLEIPSLAKTTLYLAEITLGHLGKFGFGICVAAACLTTSVGLVALASDWFSNLLGWDYKKLALGITIFSAILSTFKLDSLINFYIPILNILYPITIILIILNIFGINNKIIFRSVTFITFIFSTLSAFNINLSFIPLSSYGFAWLIPATICFIIFSIIQNSRKKTE